MSDDFYTDAAQKSERRIRKWYQEHLMPALLEAKERRARDIDASIALAEQLLKVYDEPLVKQSPKPVYEPQRFEDDSLMMPIETDVLNLLYGSTEKGAAERYLKQRYEKAPENRFYFRVTSNYDYGWQQKRSHVRARDINRGRNAILRDTFYRKNNLAPDPRHYSQPAGGEFSICSEYSCSFG